jgi:predicted RND superfamily exporter protein
MVARSRLGAVFEAVLSWHIAIVVLAGTLVPLSIHYAMRLHSSAAIGSLVVPSDPDYVATRAFQKIFPESQVVLLLLEFEHPLEPGAIAEADAVARAARTVPGVTVFSPLEIYRRTHPSFDPTRESVEDFRKFVTGSSQLRRQGLWGDRFMSVGVAFPSRGAESRDRTLARLDSALRKLPHTAMLHMRKVGAPYVESWIERESQEAQLRGFPVFALLVVGFAWFLYRSLRALLAILIALSAAVCLALGAGELMGFGITIVSALVPLTVLVTTLASLVYIHSRFVDQQDGLDLEAHHVEALTSKFMPVTASSLAAVLGFAALSISPIRPIREMGIWTAVGLTISWVVSLTLFPALQRLLRTPTGRVVKVRSALYDRVAAVVPAFAFRYRWPMLIGSILLSAVSIVTFFGVGKVKPIHVTAEGLDYIDPDLPVHRDMDYFRTHVGGLNVARVWVRLPEGSATDPQVLRALDNFMGSIERLPMVTSVVGPTTFLRMRQYLAGKGAQLPQDPDAFASLAADIETLLLSERELRNFIDVGTLGNVQLTVNFRRGEHADYSDLKDDLQQAWSKAARPVPALHAASFRLVGEAMLQAKVGQSLIPTLTESFTITAALIFLAFLVVFRSPSATLLAMIPSLFAILVTFLGLRMVGGTLNVATILIATTVLGTTENDQIHFFYHLREAKGQSFEAALKHALRVSGKAIFFATVINATGFMGLAFSNFPPLRQFGIETSVAFALAMLADFTALIGALWIVRHERPAAAT